MLPGTQILSILSIKAKVGGWCQSLMEKSTNLWRRYLWTLPLRTPHLNSSLARKQRTNWRKTDNFFSVWVWANFVLSSPAECWGQVQLLIKSFQNSKSKNLSKTTFSCQRGYVSSQLGADGSLLQHLGHQVQDGEGSGWSVRRERRLSNLHC